MWNVVHQEWNAHTGMRYCDSNFQARNYYILRLWEEDPRNCRCVIFASLSFIRCEVDEIATSWAKAAKGADDFSIHSHSKQYLK